MAFLHNKTLKVTTVLFGNGGSTVIMPGVNQVDEPALSQLQAHPLVKGKVRDNQFEFMGITVEPDGKASKKDMLANIPKMFDTKLLRSIIKDDGRPEVVECAKVQLETIVASKTTEVKETSNDHFK